MISCQETNKTRCCRIDWAALSASIKALILINTCSFNVSFLVFLFSSSRHPPPLCFSISLHFVFFSRCFTCPISALIGQMQRPSFLRAEPPCVFSWLSCCLRGEEIPPFPYLVGICERTRLLVLVWPKYSLYSRVDIASNDTRANLMVHKQHCHNVNQWSCYYICITLTRGCCGIIKCIRFDLDFINHSKDICMNNFLLLSAATTVSNTHVPMRYKIS